jgi:hypothetical protein
LLSLAPAPVGAQGAAEAASKPVAGSQEAPLGLTSAESLANPLQSATPQALQADMSLYGRRNYYVDPVVRAGDVASMDLPNLNLSLGLPNLSTWTDVDVPFIEGGRAEDVLLHLGPLKLDAERLVASVLMTDNANRTHHDRELSAVSIFAVEGIRAMWELSDTTQLALEGNLIVLPFEGKAGVNGFGMSRDTLAFAMGADGGYDPLASSLSGFHGAFTTGFSLGSWDVSLRDSFGMRDFNPHQHFDNYLEEELTMLELDINPGVQGWRSSDLASSDYRRVAGNSGYSFGSFSPGELGEPGSEVSTVSTWDRSSSSSGYNSHDDRDESTNLEFTNNLSLTLSRATGAIRPMLRVFHSDSHYWYGDEADEEREDDADAYAGMTMGLFMDNPDLRFRPYTTYTLARDTDDKRWDQTLRLGVSGPGRITDYINMSGNVGQHIRSEAGEEDERDTLYEFRLTHQPRPLTTQSFELSRYVAEPDDELRKQVTYRLRQGLGPRLAASFAVARTELERYGTTGEDEEEWGVGGSLSYTQHNFAAAWRSYYEQEWEEGVGMEDPDWKHQIDLRWRIAPRVRVRYEYTWEDNGDTEDQDASIDIDLYRYKGIWSITYRLRCRDLADHDERYIENLLVLTAVKDLDGMTIGKLFGVGH